jgi:hypothetical protein
MAMSISPHEFRAPDSDTFHRDAFHAGGDGGRYVSQPVQPPPMYSRPIPPEFAHQDAGQARHAAAEPRQPRTTREPQLHLLLPAAKPDPERWPSISDDFFLTVHDEWGDARLRSEVAGKGVAAAILAELLLTQHIEVTGSGILRDTSVFNPRDPVAAAVLETIRGEAGRLSVADWLDYLASVMTPNVCQVVADRLQTAGHITIKRRRLRSPRYRPKSMNKAASAWVALSTKLRRDDQFDAQDTAFGALMVVTGLHRVVFTDNSSAVETRMRDHLAATAPQLGELLACTEAAIDTAVRTGVHKRRR